MSIARTWAVTVTGVQGRMVEVEADLAQGLPNFAIVGLPDTSLNEARSRVRAAVVNAQLPWPARRITIGLSPASLPKRGSSFDLAIAVAVLGADGRVPADGLGRTVFVAELGLDGRVRPVPGVLPCGVAAQAAGATCIVVAEENAAEAALVPGLVVCAVTSLGHLVAVLRGDAEPSPVPDASPTELAPSPDLADVVGQVEARRALEVCAAGGHHLLLHGPPGAGKTMLAERLPGLLPRLDSDAALEVAAVRSIASGGESCIALTDRPPYVAPHHTATVPAIVGGGSGRIRPGAVTLAHRGVLFLDEAPELDRRALEALREPLESGQVTVSRSAEQVTFPARVQLVLAANPCACGAAAAGDRTCRCSPHSRRRYAAKLSGPLLDRIDVIVRVDRVLHADLFATRSDGAAGESTALVGARVGEARERARRRWSGERWECNAEVPGPALRATLAADAATSGLADLLHECVRRGDLSARGVDKVLRVAWTVADLRGGDAPTATDVGEALGLRLGGAWDAPGDTWTQPA